MLTQSSQFCQEESDPDQFDPWADDPDGAFDPPLLPRNSPVEDYQCAFLAQEGVHSVDASTARLSGLFR